MEEVWREIVIIKMKRDSKLTILSTKTKKTLIFYTFTSGGGTDGRRNSKVLFVLFWGERKILIYHLPSLVH